MISLPEPASPCHSHHLPLFNSAAIFTPPSRPPSTSALLHHGEPEYRRSNQRGMASSCITFLLSVQPLIPSHLKASSTHLRTRQPPDRTSRCHLRIPPDRGKVQVLSECQCLLQDPERDYEAASLQGGSLESQGLQGAERSVRGNRCGASRVGIHPVRKVRKTYPLITPI
jgi:hypothetical protein